MVGNYWSGVLATRASRRRVLGAAGASTAAAALLAACGGSSNGSGGKSSNKSSLVTPLKDTSSQAKKGGIHKATRTIDVVTFDAHFLSAGSIGNGTVYNRLIKLKEGVAQTPNTEFEGDLAKSWEFSPDGLTATFKLQDHMTFHNVPPVNGRAVEAEDVVQSWNRFVRVASVNANYANSVNPSAPIISLSAPDKSTVVAKLAEKSGTLLGLLATASAGLYFMPKEAGTGYDPKTVAIGAGPWSVKEYQPSVRVVYSRHPGYWDAANVFMDGVEETIITEYAARLAQFTSGAVYTTDVAQEDVLPTKQRNGDMVLTVREPTTNYGILKYGWNPALNTPFRDVRLRQALSMSIDRQLVLDTLNNLTKQRDQGIDLDSWWHSSVQAAQSGVSSDPYWLDPQSSEFGPNAKYYKYDVAEAKKLVSAAGFASGLDSVMNYTEGYGQSYVTEVQAIIGFAKEVGIRLTSNVAGFTTDFRPKFANPQGDFDGVTARLRPAGGIFHPVEIAVAEFLPAPGISYTGFFSPDSSWKNGDPKYSDLLKKARQSLDTKEQASLVKDFQRMEAANQYQPSFCGVAGALGLGWPALMNLGVYQGDSSAARWQNYWLDPSKKPLA